jgi:hypothetical protein
MTVVVAAAGPAPFRLAPGHGYAQRRELFDDCGPVESVEVSQSAIDAFVARCDTDRPHASSSQSELAARTARLLRAA